MFLIAACALDFAHLPSFLFGCVSCVGAFLVSFLGWLASEIATSAVQVAMSTDLPATYFGTVYSFWIFHRARGVAIVLMLDHGWSFADCRQLMRRKMMHALTALIVATTVLTLVRTVLELYMAANYNIAAGWFYVAGVSLGGASIFFPYLKAAQSIKMVAKTKAMV